MPLYPVRSLIFIPKVECTGSLNDYVTHLETIELFPFRTAIFFGDEGAFKTRFEEVS